MWNLNLSYQTTKYPVDLPCPSLVMVPFKTNTAKDFFTVGKAMSSFLAMSLDPHPAWFWIKNKMRFSRCERGCSVLLSSNLTSNCSCMFIKQLIKKVSQSVIFSPGLFRCVCMSTLWGQCEFHVQLVGSTLYGRPPWPRNTRPSCVKSGRVALPRWHHHQRGRRLGLLP